MGLQETDCGDLRPTEVKFEILKGEFTKGVKRISKAVTASPAANFTVKNPGRMFASIPSTVKTRSHWVNFYPITLHKTALFMLIG